MSSVQHDATRDQAGQLDLPPTDSSLARMCWENEGGACPSPGGLSSRLEKFQAGQLDPAAIESVFQHVHAQALRIAQALHRRRGSPDGVPEPAIWRTARRRASGKVPRLNWATSLRPTICGDSLHRILLNRWIDRRRKHQRLKRGGGNVIPASQLAKDDDRNQDAAGLAPPDEAEVAVDLASLLEGFAADGHERSIHELLIAGHTQAEIGEQLGISRDAVGRRIRQTIKPALARRMNSETDA